MAYPDCSVIARNSVCCLTVIREISDRTRIREFLTRDSFLHIYEIGDLDDFFWPYTRWYAWEEGSEICSLFLLYCADPACPTLLAFEEENTDDSRALMKQLIEVLPTPSIAHISLHLQPLIDSYFETTSQSMVDKMGLSGRRLKGVHQALPPPTGLGPADEQEVLGFYRNAYPDNWFDPRMLATECYLGARLDSQLVSIAGIHVYSPTYRVAALGNIATHPGYRGRGLATHLTFHLCRKLFRTVDYVGLNVQAENRVAIRCYQRLGFRVHSRFAVTRLQRRR